MTQHNIAYIHTHVQTHPYLRALLPSDLGFADVSAVSISAVLVVFSEPWAEEKAVATDMMVDCAAGKHFLL